MSVPAAGTYTISSVNRQGDQWQDSYGNDNVPYFVSLTGVEGEFELSQRASSNAPTAGQTLDIESFTDKGEFPAKIKKSYGGAPQGGGGGGSRPSGGGAKGSGGWSPEKERHVTYQHAQKVASGHINPATDFPGFAELAVKIADDAFAYSAKHGDTPAAQQAAPTVSLEGVKKELQTRAEQMGIALNFVAAAVQKVTGRPKMELGDDIEAILVEAKALADSEIPF